MPQKILIVDDEPNIVIPLQFLMEQNGYLTLVAQSGEEALEMISKETPDLVLLDIKMPGMSGLEVLEKLNKLEGRPEVVMISGHGMGRHGDYRYPLECGMWNAECGI